MVIGCKFLNADGTSLNGEYRYDLSGKWNIVPGNGSYVAITGGLSGAKAGKLLVYLDCEQPTGAKAPEGVVCFRRVRVIPDCPDRITPELRAEVVCYSPKLTPRERLELARQSDPYWRGMIAYQMPGLSAEERLELARQSDPYWMGRIASQAPDLTIEQRIDLARQCHPYWQGELACNNPELTPAQRFELAQNSTPYWRGAIAWLTSSGLTPEQRFTLALQATPAWQYQIALTVATPQPEGRGF
jgi:ribosomal protein L31